MPIDHTRGGTKSFIFHVTIAHTNYVIVGGSPHIFCVKKRWDPPGIPTLNIVVLIAGHIHIVFLGGDLRGLPSTIAIEVYYTCMLSQWE